MGTQLPNHVATPYTRGEGQYWNTQVHGLYAFSGRVAECLCRLYHLQTIKLEDNNSVHHVGTLFLAVLSDLVSGTFCLGHVAAKCFVIEIHFP